MTPLALAAALAAAVVVGSCDASALATHRDVPARAAIIDDGAGSGQSVRTEGRWEFVRGMHDGRYGGTSTRSFHPGDLLRVDFAGTGIRLDGIVGPTGGVASVGLDREPAQRVDFYRRSKGVRIPLWSRTGLDPGRHTLTVVVLAAHDAPHAGGYVNVDAFEVLPDSR